MSPHLHVPSLALGVVALTLLVTGQMRRPRWPVPLMVVVLMIGLMYLPGTLALGIATVGAIPQGLPGLALPGLRHPGFRDAAAALPRVLPHRVQRGQRHARDCSPRGMTARSIPTASCWGSEAPISPSPFGQGFPCGGGLSQSLVNDQAGARTPVAIVVCSRGWRRAALVSPGSSRGCRSRCSRRSCWHRCISMFKFDELRQLRRVSMSEFVIALVTIAAVLVLGILKGVLVAAIFSLAMLIRRLAQPECVLLGRFPGSDHFASLERYPEAVPVPGALIFRANAALLYFNADTVRERMLAMIDRATGPLQRVILDLSFSTEIDLSTARMLADVARNVRDAGIGFRLAEAHWRVRALLEEEHMGALLGDLSRSILRRGPRRRRACRRKEIAVSKPEFDIVVIGGGVGGLVVAAGAATLGAKVALVEKHRMGGDCLWYGCVPSKTLIKSARVAYAMRHADRGRCACRSRARPGTGDGTGARRHRRHRAQRQPRALSRAGCGRHVRRGRFTAPTPSTSTGAS